jgi:hypothetical protein
MRFLCLAVVLTAVVGCSTAARPPATRSGVEAVLRSVAVAPRCSPSATAAPPPLLTAVPDEVRLTRRAAVCGAASPVEVCACLAKDLAALGAGLDRGPGTCELEKVTSPSAHVATVFSTESRDGVVPAISAVVILRGAAGWAAYGVAETAAEIDLFETPQISDGIHVAALSEAGFGDARFAWIETTTTEEDVAGDERYVDATSAVTICELGETVRCGRIDTAAWHSVVARSGDDEDDEGDEDSDDD